MCKILGIIDGPAALINLEVIPSTSQDDDSERSLISVAKYNASISWNSNTGGCAKSTNLQSTNLQIPTAFYFINMAQNTFLHNF